MEAQRLTQGLLFFREEKVQPPKLTLTLNRSLRTRPTRSTLRLAAFDVEARACREGGS